MQSSRSCRIVRELRINEIKHVQSDKPLSEFTKMAEKKNCMPNQGLSIYGPALSNMLSDKPSIDY